MGTVSVAILSPGMAFKIILQYACVVCVNACSIIFLGLISDCNTGFSQFNDEVWQNHCHPGLPLLAQPLPTSPSFLYIPGALLQSPACLLPCSSYAGLTKRGNRLEMSVHRRSMNTGLLIH